MARSDPAIGAEFAGGTP